MKINAGCGKRILPGWVNVDLCQEADIRCDLAAIHKHFVAGSADVIMAIHVIEHLAPSSLPSVLRQFRAILKRGGRLILELPDVVKCARNLLDGKPDQMGLWGLYGEPTNETEPALKLAHVHKWGWTFATLGPVVAEAGFRDVVERQTEYHPVGRDCRDFRLEARK